MPGTNPPGNQNLVTLLEALERRLGALETQQQFVVTDPTKAEGDPAHNFAVVVMGNLRPICGIAAYGLATFHEGAWTQL